ncbi:MAG: UDP-N-acetylmuramate dehydrogenase [Lachnospiraceae bacterium]|nr:UDP-N-acetylmuramate dehydrogenase [Lachnospiraceae bacterium]
MLEQLREILDEERVLPDEPMKFHTTFRVGGPARYLVEPQSVPELRAVIDLCHTQKMPWYIVGNGSNLLVSDEGYDGVVIHLFRNVSGMRAEETHLVLQAGVQIVRAAKFALEHSLTGLEFASGIPGTIGGAMVMNAGAYGGEMKDVVRRVRVLLPDGTEQNYSGDEMQFGYRRSRVAAEGGIVLEVELELAEGEPESIRARMEELKQKRLAKQPLEYPSAGSTFKRLEGYFAGKLIEDAQLRGFRVGGAQVSEKHCGFVINRGDATASQIWELIGEVQRRVYEQSGVRLEPEVKLLGFGEKERRL